MPRIFKSLKGKLAIYFAFAIIFSLLLSGFLSVGLVQHYLRQRMISDLQSQVESIASQVETEGLPLRRYVQDLEQVQGVRVSVVPRQEGAALNLPVVPGQGLGPAARLEASGELPFIDWEQIGRGETQTLETDLPGMDRKALAAAHGFSINGELAGAVIVSKAVTDLQPWQPLAGELLIAAAIALAISLLFAFLLARHLSRPLHEITQAAVAVADGDYSRQVGIQSSDEIGQLADAFRHMTAQVQKSQDQQRQFVINVSHELKTPLTAINGHVQALKDGIASDPEDVARSLEVISAETGRLKRLIDDLLNLAKFDAHQFELRNSTVHLGDLLPSVVSGFEGEARERSIELGLEEGEDIILNTDPDRLRQVLTNLLQNSLAHTPSGGSVRIKYDSGAGQARIAVSDSGSGISEADLPHVFDRFYRSGEGTLEAGLGLGLPISRELAQAMGGDISVATSEGGGSTFTVILPLGS